MKSKEEMVAYALRRAPKDPDKAEDVLAFFCGAVERREPPDVRILAYLAERFRRVLDGAPAAQALWLARRKGQRRGRGYQRIDERDRLVARAVAGLMRGGMYRDDAFEHVAAESGNSTSTVRRAYEALGHLYS